MARTLTAAILALGIGAGAAQAQEPSQDGHRFLTASPAGAIRASKLIGLPVTGQDHVKVGSIEDVLVDDNGRVLAVLIGVGGFLGIGEKRVAVPYQDLALNTDGDAGAAGPTSVVTPKNAPSTDAATTAGPETMPGAQTSSQALEAVEARRSGTVDDKTGSTARTDDARGRATVMVGEPSRAEIRLTKAQLQAAPAFQDARTK
ncbi:PRC-barrel domain-containing protein [Methylobacterium soli]|uniref:PRC-barrel domain containing protein n=1 Tax=Methylobacterium soli TaxID=553447 RepID=A0A6L3SXA7_9HYPH|nr:PRC-barrel domain-containing protein [Methylobacterium soli]KAB1078546.1 PRC-barrel domain containing protein [Methylobacterium soli]